MKAKQKEIKCNRCKQNKPINHFDLEGLLSNTCNSCKIHRSGLTKKEKKNDNPGIYKIKNKVTGKVYIGESSHLQKRKANYFGNLKGYINKELKEDMKLYGKDKFSYTVLKVMPFSTKEERLNMELFFKKKEKGELYNILPDLETKEAYQTYKENKKE